MRTLERVRDTLGSFLARAGQLLDLSELPKCPNCSVRMDMVGVDATYPMLLAVYRCPHCGQEDRIAQPLRYLGA
jgi:DNA-directed RNA polymerase subunit RPC12/RpoP